MVWVRRIAIGLAVVVVVAVLAVAVAGTMAVRRSYPLHDGERRLAILDAEVEVLRDGNGIPTIVASTPADLFRAQGYVHAQDRFWEMDLRRHVTAGRTAELFGAAQLDTDRFVRTLGWRRVAEAELELLDDEARETLEAYAEGVNAWMDGRRGSQLSLEHALLPLAGARGYEPEPWTPADSVAWLKAMAWDLRSNMESEIERGRLLAVLDRTRIDELYPPFPYDRHTPIIPAAELSRAGGADGERAATDVATAGDRDEVVQVLAEADDALARTQAAVAAMPDLLGPAGEGIGSNSWVVAPERSATGSALLANDPHLGPVQPSLWHQVALRCEPRTDACPYHVTGFSFSGFPGVIIGHNDRIAWGFTNLGTDVTDLFVERLDGDRYLTEDGWVNLEVRTETIEVAGGDPVEHVVRSTRHGPLLSDVSGGATEVAEGPLGAGAQDAGDLEHGVALRWTALDPGETANALLPLNRAGDFTEFRAAVARFVVPAQNLVYADVDGHIGYQAPGRTPIRRAHDGTHPVPGWTGEHGWDGFVDFDDLPWLLDPAEGVIVTANQTVLGPDPQVFLRSDRDADPGYRGQRIRDLLDERDRLSLDDLAAIQMDEHNANAAHLVPFLLDVDVPGDVADAQALLAGWDLQDHRDSAASAFFNATWRHLLARTFHPELPEWAEPGVGARWWEVVRWLTGEPDHEWWDDPTTAERETRDDVLRGAMTDAHAELTDRLGDDVDAWRWGALHTLTLTHDSFGRSGIGPIERLFNRGPVELGGGTAIVNANGWAANLGYEVIWVPSMRLLVDMGDLDAGRWIHLTGQSGRPFHPHYTDQVDDWAAGSTLPIAFGPEAAEAAAVARLRLLPQ